MNATERHNIGNKSYLVPMLIWFVIFLVLSALAADIQFFSELSLLLQKKGEPVAFGMWLVENEFATVGDVKYLANNIGPMDELFVYIAGLFCVIGFLISVAKLALLKDKAGVSQASELRNW